MRPVSTALAAAVRSSHVMSARARIVSPGLTGTNPTGTFIPIIDGDVKLDSTADIRGTLDLTTDGTAWDPRVGRHIIQPYGAEVFVERGVQITAGSTEWVSQGYFRLYEVEQDEAPNGPLRLSGRDRMSAIVDAKLLAPRQFAATTLASTVFTTLVQEVLPGAIIDFTATDQTLGRVMVTEDDRYGFLKDIADSLGAVMYWDYQGHLAVKPAPSPTGAAVFTVNAGTGGVLISSSRSLSRDEVYNAVVATGEGADDVAAVRAVAYDNNEQSPTYWSGGFGKVPKFYSSPLLTTRAQAQSAATAMLLKSTGLPFLVDFSAVPHPGLEPLDIVSVSTPPFTQNHIIDTLTIPLTADGAMSGTTRQQLLTNIGVI